MDLSVVICTHNPRPGYLRRALDGLRKQTLSYDRWEVVLVDNESTPPIASSVDLSWHPNARCVVEGRLGLAFARQRGMREAQADLVVFVDDDNVLDPNYLSTVMLIENKWPQLGVWGSGSIIPEFEVPPDQRLHGFLDLRDSKQAYWSNVPNCEPAMPWGCGLCVRESVAKAYCIQYERSNLKITGRLGNGLMGGEDTEIGFVACSLGLGIAVFPELRLTHLTPAERLGVDYVLRAAQGNTASRILMQYKWQKTLPPSPYSLRSLASVLKSVITTRGLDRSIRIASWRGAVTAMRAIETAKHLRS